MSIPRWKKMEIEKAKPAPKTQNAEDKSTADTKTAAPKQNVFKPPQNIQVTWAGKRQSTLLGKEPAKKSRRLIGGSFEDQSIESASNATGALNTPLASIIPNASRDPRVRNTPAVTPIQKNSTVVASSSVIMTVTGQRMSAKQRLGNVFHSNQTTNQMPMNKDSDLDPKASNLTVITSRCVANNAHVVSNDEVSMPPITVAQLPAFSTPSSSDQNGMPQSVDQASDTAPLLSSCQNGYDHKKLIQLIVPSFASGPQKYEPVFSYIFKRTCRIYMNQGVCQDPVCSLQHVLPDHETVRKLLDKMFENSVNTLYNEYMCRNQMLFDEYFKDFCDYFGNRKNVEQLKKMVEDCVERKMETFFIRIIDGFTLTGKSFTKALIEVIEAIACRRNRTSKEIIKLMLHTRNSNIKPFLKILDAISKQPNFKFQREWVNTLMGIHKEKTDGQLKKDLGLIVWRIIENHQDCVDREEYSVDLLKEFMDWVQKNLSTEGK